MFSNLLEDWQTYQSLSRQGLWVMAVYRFGRWRYGIRPRVVRLPFSFLYRVLKVGIQILTGVDIPCEVTLGRRFLIEHFGGIVINGDAVFGDDCVIRNGVTVGIKRIGEKGVPVFGDRVDIGAGAVVLGAIHIGNDVTIGANAVVISDIPSNCIAVGVPAKAFPQRVCHQPADCSFNEKGVLA
jgi:serine O-acetyltransferase